MILRGHGQANCRVALLQPYPRTNVESLCDRYTLNGASVSNWMEMFVGVALRGHPKFGQWGGHGGPPLQTPKYNAKVTQKFTRRTFITTSVRIRSCRLRITIFMA